MPGVVRDVLGGADVGNLGDAQARSFRGHGRLQFLDLRIAHGDAVGLQRHQAFDGAQVIGGSGSLRHGIGRRFAALGATATLRAGVLAGSGVLLGLLTVLKLLDLGSSAVVGRPFDPLTDWSAFGAALGFLRRSAGGLGASVAAAGAVLLAVALVVLVPLSLVRLGRVTASRRRTSTVLAAALSTTWAVAAALGTHVAPGVPASAATNRW